MHGLLLSFCCLLLSCTPTYALTPSAPAGAAQPTDTCTIRPARQQILLSGFTRAQATLDIIPEVSGRCERIAADTGEIIAPDGIFAVIDSTLVKLDQKANSVKQEQLKRKLRFETRQVKRYQQLHSSKSSSLAQLDEQELQRDQSRLELEQLQVEAEQLQELLARHTIRAPVGWHIIERNVEPGQWVASSRVLARAGDYQTLIIPLAVTPAELHSLQQTPLIPISLPAHDLNGSASLSTISPGFDPVTRKIRIELSIDQPTYTKIPFKQGGLRVKIPVHIPDPMHGFLVPAAAVEERYEEHWLTRPDQSRIPVIVLGPAAGQGDGPDLLRITSPDIKAGETFLLHATAPDRP